MPMGDVRASHGAGGDGMRRVDFFIVGVQKGGTTALDAHLRRAAGVQMADVKEVHHFDDDARDWQAADPAPLHAHYDWAAPGVVVRGEATPISVYWPGVLERIRRYNPAARLILLLRQPARRAWSHWRMETSRGAETLPFATAIAGEGRRRVAAAAGGVHRVYSYVERGFYAAQAERLLALFPRRQLLALRTDALWSRPDEVLGQVHRFLGIAPATAAARGFVGPRFAAAAVPVADPHLLAELTALYAADVRRTEALLGIGLADWLEPGYVEPMADA